ncbi:MAG: glycosyltransferase family 2 protein, partial [Clostridia bacterium]|nr:glycosyltransferase family 2 protein [Clostridia bacterium]
MAVLICARNEAGVIGNLLDSLEKQDYPKALYRVFVVAHNCTDDTARVARENGATVFVHDAPNERTKGHALRAGTRALLREYAGQFDAICVFDADNLASRTFLSRIVAALMGGADVAQGYRASKNEHASWISELFAAFWRVMLRCQNMPFYWLSLPCLVGGTGFILRADCLPKDGWHTWTLLEDVEFSLQQALAGRRVVPVPDALFFDEQPTDLKTAVLQRYRWSVGGMQCMKRYVPQLLRWLPKGGGVRAAKCVIDLMTNPALICAALGELFKLAHLASVGANPWQTLLTDLLFAYLLCLPWGFLLYVRERINPLRNLRCLMLFPLFVFLALPLACMALFRPNTRWVPILHDDPTTIDDLEP